MYVRHIMTEYPETLNVDASFLDALTIMRDKKIRHLPVVDDNDKLLGMVTDRDLLKQGAAESTVLSVRELITVLSRKKVKDLMIKREKLFVAEPDMIIERAAKTMYENRIGALPVVEGDKLVGIMATNDILELFVEAMGFKTDVWTRITFDLPDTPGQLLDIAQIIKKSNVNIVSVITPKIEQGKDTILVVRIQTNQPDEILANLKEAGYKIESVIIGGSE
ncbi:MAG TPA: CBS and ACT domain-containing protein [Desulfobacteraceae bacterium]|nr:CBS and ACT domain-containing protein [Desulfobacteraceae bacterium]HPJ66866.1 CBS and ACT domain-containing protein [Desulfobacteraceae bacterium]HPQ28438.1 CBS and ACT domain-containing protein [Desulfobacteraceae bacterium]